MIADKSGRGQKRQDGEQSPPERLQRLGEAVLLADLKSAEIMSCKKHQRNRHHNGEADAQLWILAQPTAVAGHRVRRKGHPRQCKDEGQRHQRLTAGARLC